MMRRAGGAVHGHERANDPAVGNAEKFMQAVRGGDISAVYNTLDPKIVLNGPMGVFQSRPHVKAWLEFEHEVLRGAPIEVRGTTSVDGLKVACTTWSVHGLHFTDTVTLNQVLSIRTIRRSMVRRYRTEVERERSEALLLAWTGPYFSKYCGTRPDGIDNRALILPLLDYAYMELENVRDLLTIRPKGGKEVQETSVVFHFLRSMAERERGEQLAAERASAGEGPKDDPTTTFTHREEVTIRAKNREGEQAAIVIDRAMLEGKRENRVDSLEDGEVVVKEDRMRFVCSGVKLCNNNLSNCRELDIIFKLYIVNAFYFLSVLDLSSNRIEEIPNLSQFPLQALYLHDNLISDIGQAEQLRDLTTLTSLTLFGNPIQSNARSAKEYKYRVLSVFWNPPVAKQQRPRTPPRTPFEVADDERKRLAAEAEKERERREQQQHQFAFSPASQAPAASTGGTQGGARQFTAASRSAAATSATGRRLSGKPTSPLPPALSASQGPSTTTPATAARAVTKSRPLSAVQLERRRRERQRLERGFISLRTLDHSVVSPLELEAVERFVAVFHGGRRDRRSPSARPHSRQ